MLVQTVKITTLSGSRLPPPLLHDLCIRCAGVVAAAGATSTHLEPVLPEVLQQLPGCPLLLCWPCISEACEHHGHSWSLILSHKLLDGQVLHDDSTWPVCRNYCSTALAFHSCKESHSARQSFPAVRPTQLLKHHCWRPPTVGCGWTAAAVCLHAGAAAQLHSPTHVPWGPHP